MEGPRAKFLWGGMHLPRDATRLTKRKSVFRMLANLRVQISHRGGQEKDSERVQLRKSQQHRIMLACNESNLHRLSRQRSHYQREEQRDKGDVVEAHVMVDEL